MQEIDKMYKEIKKEMIVSGYFNPIHKGHIRLRWRCSTKKCWMICLLAKINLKKQNGLNMSVPLSNYIYVKI
mgnify:FL=1|tara:strand:- start:648 stop:863 length:216 start_codon:yes stop_codon:yes gene_type:complete